MKGVALNQNSYLYGEFRLPEVLTNDLVNNKEFKFPEMKSISMSHIKRVSRVKGKTRVLVCSEHCWQNQVDG